MMDNFDMRVRKKLTYFLEINIQRGKCLGEWGLDKPGSLE